MMDTPSPLHFLMGSPRGWVSSHPDSKAAYQGVLAALRSGRWDAELLAAQDPRIAPSGGGMLERFLAASVPQDHDPQPHGISARRRRRVAVALASRGCAIPSLVDCHRYAPEDFLLVAALEASRAGLPAQELVEQASLAEGLWGALFAPGAGLPGMTQFLAEKGLEWSSPLLGTTVLDMALGMAHGGHSGREGWLSKGRTPASTGGTIATQRRKDWLYMAQEIVPKHGTARSRALLLLASDAFLQPSNHNLRLSAENDPVKQALRQVVPPSRVAHAIEELCTLPASLAAVVAWPLTHFLAKPMFRHAVPPFRGQGRWRPCPALPPGWDRTRAWSVLLEHLATLPPLERSYLTQSSFLQEAGIALGACPLEAIHPKLAPPHHMEWWVGWVKAEVENGKASLMDLIDQMVLIHARGKETGQSTLLPTQALDSLLPEWMDRQSRHPQDPRFVAAQLHARLAQGIPAAPVASRSTGPRM